MTDIEGSDFEYSIQSDDGKVEVSMLLDCDEFVYPTWCIYQISKADAIQMAKNIMRFLE